MSWIDSYIRDVPDFPKPGIMFKDITPLVQHPDALKRSVDEMAELFPLDSWDQIVAVESRGFIFGTAMAYKLGRGCTLVRKQGKLPHETMQHEYQLEYGEAAVEIHIDGLEAGQRALIVDDLLATGGTVGAAAALVEKLGATVAGAVFLVELAFLNGSEPLEFPVKALRTY